MVLGEPQAVHGTAELGAMTASANDGVAALLGSIPTVRRATRPGSYRSIYVEQLNIPALSMRDHSGPAREVGVNRLKIGLPMTSY